MGMVGNVIQINEIELNRFRENSKLLKEYTDNIENLNESNFLYLDKLWDALHFILTGNSFLKNLNTEPGILERALFSFSLIDENQDIGYGPAHFLTSIQVKETNLKIQKLNINEIVNKIDLQIMSEKKVYPEIWHDPDTKNYIKKTLEEFMNFYEEASNKNAAIITFIN